MSAVRARERRIERLAPRLIAQAEALFHAEVGVHMAKGLSFDEAWLAAGGTITPLATVAEEQNFDNEHGAAVREIMATTGDYWAGFEEDRPLLELPPFIVEDAT